MKKYQILAIALLVLSSCGTPQGEKQSSESKTDSSAVEGTTPTEKTLVAEMAIKDTIKTGDSVLLTFTVRNNTADSLNFCKWHTPFEPLMSKYLDVTADSGAEADYKGPMAKRISPPPATSYINVKANDSISVKVDLLKAYKITKPAKYTITYNSKEISGLTVKNSVSFVYVK